MQATLQSGKATIMRKGYLLKCAKVSGKNWRKRFFLLTGNTLNYYLDEKSSKGKPKGNVLIVGDGKVLLEDDVQQKDTGASGKVYGFRLVTPFDSILFLTVTENDRNAWMKAMQVAIDVSQKSMRGYMILRTKALSFGENKVRKFWVLNHDTLTYHQDHENTSIDQYALTIDQHTQFDFDDEKWKIKISDGTGSRQTTMQFESRTMHDFPVWKSAMLAIKFKHENAKEAKQVQVQEAMSAALVSGDLDVRQEDGSWIPNTVAFTDVEVVLQGVQEGSEAEFHALSPSSTIIALSAEDAGGREHAFQLTAAKSIIQMCANSQEEVDTWIQWMQEIIPVPITVDAQEILFRAALKKVNDEEYYEVIIEEKKALGVVFQPVEEWAVVKNYDGYDPSITGISPGSVLCDINDTSYKFDTFDNTTKALSDAFKAPESMKLRFRRAPVKEGKLNKRSAVKKGGNVTWAERSFKLAEGTLYILPDEHNPESKLIEIPLKDAAVALVPFSEHLRENCFRLQLGMVSMVLQGLDLSDMLDWAATLSHAIALASGGQYVLDYEAQKAQTELELQAALDSVNPDMDEASTAVLGQLHEALLAEDPEMLGAALDLSHNTPGVLEFAPEFVSFCQGAIDRMYEEQHHLEEDLIALQATAQPDLEQQRLLSEEAAMREAMQEFDVGAGDSDDEGDMSPEAQAYRQSIQLNATRASTMGGFEDGGGFGEEDDEAESRHMKQLEALAAPDPEEEGEVATADDLAKMFEFYSRTTDEQEDAYINVMGFCQIWRMVDGGKKGNLHAQMKIFNKFDHSNNGFLEVQEFIDGFQMDAAETGQNRRLIKLRRFVEGRNVML